MAFDIHIELRVMVRARADIAFQLGQVDAVCGKSAERLVKGCRHAAYGEDHGGDHRLAIHWRGNIGARHDEEPRRVVFGVLCRWDQYIKVIDLACQCRGDGTNTLVAARGYVLGRTGSVGVDHRLQAKRAQPLAALRQTLGMAVNLDKIFKCGAARRQQLVVHPLKMLAIDKQTRSRKKMVDVGDAASNRILDRHHRQLGTTFLNGEDHVLKRPAGHDLHLRLNGLAGHMRIGAEHPLKGNNVAAVGHITQVRHSCGSP